MTFIVGDIIELQHCKAPLAIPNSHYEIIRFGPRAVKLWRLLENKQTATTLGRTIVIPIAQLDHFRLATIGEQE